jgi:uncharacterized coiled-coil protein SlyX
MSTGASMHTCRRPRRGGCDTLGDKLGELPADRSKQSPSLATLSDKLGELPADRSKQRTQLATLVDELGELPAHRSEPAA